ncbi:MAG: DUF6076 domain-containing protein [Anaerobutyricum hallii]|uniref:DUF6076 domain-containing protein n=1 Tax=Anaerobutyricum hallii TaxID=39488 RepID=UPI002431B2C3|nr:DUF6076 domain-containing protein [Anaerobutyricum hallii]MDD6587976.1 DUF6076 domain-containing protein [Anaerobutyricum hallii]
MYRFPALFYGTSVILNNKIKFDCNEILTGYLNSDTDGFREMLKQLNRNLDKLTMDTDMDYSFAEQRYDEVVYETQEIMSKLDKIWTSLPPYSLLLSKQEKSKKRLVACMKKHSNLFESEDENSASTIDFDNHVYQHAETKYGYIEFYPDGHILVNLRHFQPTRFLDEYLDKMDDVQLLLSDMYAFNNDLENVFYWYINWINSVLRVKDAYAPLLQEFIHVRHGYLTDTEQAEQIAAFLMKTKKESQLQTQKLVAASQFSLSYSVYTPEDSVPVLCKRYEFSDLDDFLYMDFFTGLEKNYLPKKCSNCGKWFLLRSGNYSDYCDNPLPDQPDRTCRDTSARKKYEDKCKTDPIWLTYNRAYKTHYARYMKGKMTQDELEIWGRKAIDLREQAISGEISYDDYYEQIRK